ncbi:MAG: metal-dependent transcriptional regulator [Candidatus Krumholzibacteria bacterium]|nr:metal-dependent transcriptional regulator [Candidatus Krumholzibacteria bacterium]
MVGVAIQDYVKAIYKLSQKKQKVTPSGLAETLGVSAAAVTKMVRRLQDLKLVRYAKTQGLRLSPTGEKIALEMIRHHRLLELYLTEALGYGWDEVHDEAEKLEHVISEQFEEKIERLLGYPTHDPHGAPIPTREGHIERAELTVLSQLETGAHGCVERVSDSDAQMLTYLGELGLYPGTPVEMIAREPYGGSLHVRISGQDHAIGLALADNVFVSVREGSDD